MRVGQLDWTQTPLRRFGHLIQTLQLQEQAGDPRSDRASGQFAGELQEEPALFHIQQRQGDPIG
jgi:hypothetical protein